MTEFYETKVPSIGPPKAKIAIIGEAPGNTEVKYGEPFVGRSGHELDRLLRAAGIQREKIFITNASKYPVRGDKDLFFMTPDGPSRKFSEGIREIHEEVRARGVNVCIPMGNWALWALTGRTSISKYRGSILYSPLTGTKTVPTFHPAYLLRGRSNHRPFVVWDLTRAKEESETSLLDLPKRDLIINPSEAEIETAINRLLSGDHITYDTEWYSPTDLSCIGFTNDPSWAICIPAFYKNAFRVFRLLLENDLPKIAQNAMFDIFMLSRLGIQVRNSNHDTMVRHSICWPDLKENSLDTLTSIYTREPYYKDDLKIANATGNKSLEYEYNCKDAAVTDECAIALEKEEEYCGTAAGYRISMGLFNIMSSATIFGIRADRDRLFSYMSELDTGIERNHEELVRRIGRDINVRSAPQVAKLVYDDLKFKSAARTTEQDHLIDMAAASADIEKREILTLVVLERRSRNLRSRYINETILDSDNRIRTIWNLVGTKNGRLGSGKLWGGGVALQTIPDEALDIFVADEGTRFVGWDQAQAEARIVAVLTGDEQLLEWMETGVDIHSKLAELMFGIPYAEISKTSRDRYMAKTCRHALNYRMGWKLLKTEINGRYLETGIGVTAAEAKRLRERYLAASPGLQTWWGEVGRELQRNGFMTNAFGRKRRFLGEYNDSLLRDGIAFYPQSTVADLNSLGIIALAAEFPDVTVLAHTHDGGFAQVPESQVEEVIARIPSLMEIPVQVRGTEIVIPIEAKHGENWAEIKKISPRRIAT